MREGTEEDSASNLFSPIAIGGVGGSGTRMIAQLLRDMGYYLGSELNAANDNLWFALIFNRLDILIEPRNSFNMLAKIFYERMRGRAPFDTGTRGLVEQLAHRPHPQHSAGMLKKTSTSFLDLAVPEQSNEEWGWKVPTTHIMIERFLEFYNKLKYIHVIRHGLDMAFSKNQNQLRLWGPVFLGREVELSPRDSLAFWCAAHRRMERIADRFGDRIMFVNYDHFCASPTAVSRDILSFIGRNVEIERIEDFAKAVITPESAGRFRIAPVSNFDPEDVAYVAKWGYPTE